ncbi:hypothetical protein ACTFIT_012303 [Dictyostelium discoideum]
MLNPIPISIPEGLKSDCITKEVQNLLLDDAIEQVLPNRYSKRVFYSNVFTVPKSGTNLHRPILDLKRLNTYINNQSFKMEGIKNLPSMVKQCYYMVKLDIKKAYLHVLVDPQYRYLFPIPPRIFTMLLRPVLRMLRDINVSVIAYLDDLLIIGSIKEECLSNLKKTMDLLVKLGFKLNLEKSVLEPTQANGDWDQSFPIPQEVNSEISHWLTVLNQWNGKEISLFPSYDYVLTTDTSESGAGATLKKGNKVIKTWSFQWSTTQSNMSSNRREMLALLMAYQALWWSDTRSLNSVRTTLETMPQEESELDWRAYSRILQCPVINAKEQRSGVVSILELTWLDDTNSQVCPVRHLATYLRASKGRRKPHSGDFVFIKNEGEPLQVNDIISIVLSTLSKSGMILSSSNLTLPVPLWRLCCCPITFRSTLSKRWVVGNQMIL